MQMYCMYDVQWVWVCLCGDAALPDHVRLVLVCRYLGLKWFV